MRYFTPELFARLQDLDDRAALKEWDRSAERYSTSLQQIHSRLPVTVRKLAGLPLLHDAEVLCIAQSRDKVSITLEPESDDGRLIVLSYTVVEDPQINRSAFPDTYRTEYVAWLYDEIALGKPGARRPSFPRGATARDGRVPVYHHDILLSNGWELSLRFRSVKIARPRRLLPSLPADGNAKGELSRSA
jgi:hypothetical protein